MGASKCNDEAVVPGRRARSIRALGPTRWWQGLPGVCYGSLLRRRAAPRRNSAPWLLYDGWQTCLACRTSRVQVLFATREAGALTRSNPVPFCGHKSSGEPVWERLRGGAASRASSPNPNPIGQKFVSSPPSIIIAKALPFVRCALRTSLLRLPIRRQRRPSLPRLPNRCKNHHGCPPAQRAPHGPRGNLQTSAPGR